MNGAEQRQRATAVNRAEARLDHIEPVIIALAEEIVKNRDAAAAAVNDERTHRLKLADEQRGYVDAEDRATLLRAKAAFTSMTFWQRLRWLVRGTA